MYMYIYIYVPMYIYICIYIYTFSFPNLFSPFYKMKSCLTQEYLDLNVTFNYS